MEDIDLQALVDATPKGEWVVLPRGTWRVVKPMVTQCVHAQLRVRPEEGCWAVFGREGSATTLTVEPIPAKPPAVCPTCEKPF